MSVRRPNVRSRDQWGRDLPPVGPLQPEEDVRFLLVHHTATPNRTSTAPADQLRSFYRYHTVEKGWPDLAYNFMVDSTGQVWEGRSGSLAGAVRGDATGGSQGHAILSCFIGDFASEEPSSAAQQSMTSLLAWLADLHSIDLAKGSEVRFRSRGSSRWPEGAHVTTQPIAGHRDMSTTPCPGDAAYALIDRVFLPGARDLVAHSRPVLTSTPVAPVPSPTTTTVEAPQMAGSEGRESKVVGADREDSWRDPALVVGGAVVTGGLAWVIARRIRAGV